MFTLAGALVGILSPVSQVDQWKGVSRGIECVDDLSDSQRLIATPGGL